MDKEINIDIDKFLQLVGYTILGLFIIFLISVPIYNHLNPTHKTRIVILEGDVTKVELKRRKYSAWINYTLIDNKSVSHTVSTCLLNIREGDPVKFQFTYKILATGGEEFMGVKPIQ